MIWIGYLMINRAGAVPRPILIAIADLKASTAALKVGTKPVLDSRRRNAYSKIELSHLKIPLD
jgi:hypothetical protein